MSISNKEGEPSSQCLSPCVNLTTQQVQRFVVTMPVEVQSVWSDCHQLNIKHPSLRATISIWGSLCCPANPIESVDWHSTWLRELIW